MRFRPYSEHDLQAMFLLDVACFEPPFRFGVEDLRGFAAEPNMVTCLAEDGALAGFVMVECVDDAAYLVTLDVSPERQRQGLGRELLRRAEQAFAEAQRMVLHVHTGNESAIGFYEANGYRRVGEEKSFYGYGRDAWVYMKELASSEPDTR